MPETTTDQERETKDVKATPTTERKDAPVVTGKKVEADEDGRD